MNRQDGSTHLLHALIGPSIWAATFAGVYALNGLGCAHGWPDITIGVVSLHMSLMLLTWIVGVAACGLLLMIKGSTLRQPLPRAGLWIGLIANVFTLSPLLLASSC
ncbi:hypothetical protein ACLBXM_06720 [Xanthobacteraceae bacterium A53D]